MHCAFSDFIDSDFPRLTYDCQFGSYGLPLISVDKKSWCFFHCPMKDENGKLTEKAAWEENGPEYQAFMGEIHRRRNTEEAVQAQANMDGNKESVKSYLNLIGVVFPFDVDFARVEFPRVSFQYAAFSGDADFRGAIFRDDTFFCGVTFGGEAAFRWARFVGKGDFEKATFIAIADFDSAKFNGQAWFSRATFMR